MRYLTTIKIAEIKIKTFVTVQPYVNRFHRGPAIITAKDQITCLEA